MKNLNFTTVTVIDSTGNQNVLENVGDPNSIEWVCIENRKYGFKFLLHKSGLKQKFNHPKSVKCAKDVHQAGRLGDRFEWISVYNAIHTANLNGILARISGDIICCRTDKQARGTGRNVDSSEESYRISCQLACNTRERTCPFPHSQG